MNIAEHITKAEHMLDLSADLSGQASHMAAVQHSIAHSLLALVKIEQSRVDRERSGWRGGPM